MVKGAHPVRLSGPGITLHWSGPVLLPVCPCFPRCLGLVWCLSCSGLGPVSVPLPTGFRYTSGWFVRLRQCPVGIFLQTSPNIYGCGLSGEASGRVLVSPVVHRIRSSVKYLSSPLVTRAFLAFLAGLGAWFPQICHFAALRSVIFFHNLSALSL